MIADDGIEQKLVRFVAAARPSAERPYVVGDEANYPRAFVLVYESCGRTGAPSGRAERLVGRRIVEDWSGSPIEAMTVLRRQKERCVTVA